MFDFFSRLFDYGDFNPRNTCGAGWNSGLVWLHILGDFLIWFSYMAIPCVLIYYVRKRRDVPFHHIFWLFGAFILSCGLGHFVEMLMFSYPMYRLDGFVKLVTAAVSLGTVGALIPVTPRLMALRSPRELEAEIAERKRAEADLQALNATLEQRVAERTAALEQRAQELSAAMEGQKRAEANLALRAADLERSNIDLEQFAYVASHDLREPLRMISNYVQLLDRNYKGRLDGQADKYIHYAVDGVRHMDSLIADLLAYSRVGKADEPMERIDLGAVAEEVRTYLKTTISEAGAQIQVGPLPAVMGHRTQLTQLFQNLLDNAIKFRDASPPRIEVGATPEGPAWLFFVRDQGIGFDPDFSSRLFKMFQRLEGKEKYPGSGIGLAIAKKIVERHGGRIWAESRPGQGATFYFTLPMAAQREHSA